MTLSWTVRGSLILTSGVLGEMQTVPLTRPTVQKAWQDPLHDLWMGHPASDFWPPELQVNVSEMPIVLSHSFW